MKKINSCIAALILISFFFITSCEKGDLADEDSIVTIEVDDDLDLSKVKPNAVSETYKFGKTIEELGKSRPQTLTATTPWKRITKNEVRAVGIPDSQVFDVVTDEYFSGYTGPSFGLPISHWGVVSVSLGPNNSDKYGWGNYWSDISNPSTPEFQFYGQGDVSQNTGFSLWKRVSGVSAQVHPNNHAAGQVWITTAQSSSHSFTVEASSTVTAGGSIGIPFVAEGEASVAVTLGASYTYTNEKSFSENFYFPQVHVPNGKSVRYQLEERWVPVQTEWKFPIKFRGNYAVGIEVGFGPHGGYMDKQKVNVSAFNDNYAQPGMYHTIVVKEHLSHEFRVAAYIID